MLDLSGLAAMEQLLILQTTDQAGARNLDALFTMQSLLSLQGSAAAALLVPNGLVYLIGDTFRPYTKWVSFAIAMFLSYLVAYLAPGGEFTKWVLAFFNGFLVFASAVGINEGASKGTRLGRGRFFSTWF